MFCKLGNITKRGVSVTHIADDIQKKLMHLQMLWFTHQQILKRIGQLCLRTVLHGFLIEKLLNKGKTTIG